MASATSRLGCMVLIPSVDPHKLAIDLDDLQGVGELAFGIVTLRDPDGEAWRVEPQHGTGIGTVRRQLRPGVQHYAGEEALVAADQVAPNGSLQEVHGFYETRLRRNGRCFDVRRGTSR